MANCCAGLNRALQLTSHVAPQTTKNQHNQKTQKVQGSLFDPVHSQIKGPVFDVSISSVSRRNLDSGSIILGFRALGFRAFKVYERSQASLSLAAGQRAETTL